MDPLINDPSMKGIVGIQNLGNTCYCNATLQLLRASPEWNMFCLTQAQEENPNTPPQRILYAYQEILKSLWSASYPAYVRPLGFFAEIIKAVKDTPYEMFGQPVPNDAHEYLVYLLDHFHEAIKKESPYREIIIDTDDAEHRMRIMAENGWNTYHSKNMSHVVSLFFGMIRKTIQCSNCLTKSYRWEVFNSIKIPCDGVTVYDWIRNEVNEVFDMEGYRCDVCQAKYTAKISSHLWRLPRTLFITVRRFQPNGHKNMTTCPYDGLPISFKEFFALEADQCDNSYELRGICDHHGSHMGGHYTTQFKHPISNEWWWLDDERAQKIPEPKMLASNYIFLFRAIRKS